MRCGAGCSIRSVTLGVVGEQTGSAELFREASTALRTSLEGRDRLREAPAWALTQLNLGTSLRLYAEKAGDTNAMAEAIVAYRAALSIPLPEEHAEIRTRAQAPLEEVTSPRPAPPPA
ncbi:MAG TPA: hypothetical protein VJU15_04535 [Gemmatimonadales bacterium]|nr:hypothetical protein [Gemmatimonadales bacterium]